MKNLDIKKLLVFLGLIILIVGGVIFTITHNKSKEEEKNIREESENITVKYFANLTQGYSSVYSGLDVLYNQDKVTAKDLEYGAIINTAVKYAQDNNINLNVNKNVIDALEKSKKYGSMKQYTAYNGENLRNTIKLLFGDVEEPLNMTGSLVYLYDYIYVFENDIYLMKKNDKVSDFTDASYFIDYSLVKQESKKDTVKTTIAIAYVKVTDGNYTYYSDSKATNEIASEIKEFPEEKRDEFDKFTFTLKKTDDGYRFESVEKVK